jgi:hypothetical protein
MPLAWALEPHLSRLGIYFKKQQWSESLTTKYLALLDSAVYQWKSDHHLIMTDSAICSAARFWKPGDHASSQKENKAFASCPGISAQRKEVEPMGVLWLDVVWVCPWGSCFGGFVLSGVMLGGDRTFRRCYQLGGRRSLGMLSSERIKIAFVESWEVFSRVTCYKRMSLTPVHSSFLSQYVISLLHTPAMLPFNLRLSPEVKSMPLTPDLRPSASKTVN